MKKPNENKVNVLLVEDSPLIREIVLENLAGLDNAEVVSFADKQSEALVEIEKHQPDLVIVDLELTEGNGLGVLAQLKAFPEKFGDPKKIVFTNHTSPLLKRKCEATDIQGFFDKSYQLDEMLDYVSSMTA